MVFGRKVVIHVISQLAEHMWIKLTFTYRIQVKNDIYTFQTEYVDESDT
jgi:hypothetical protein